MQTRPSERLRQVTRRPAAHSRIDRTGLTSDRGWSGSLRQQLRKAARPIASRAAAGPQPGTGPQSVSGPQPGTGPQSVSGPQPAAGPQWASGPAAGPPPGSGTQPAARPVPARSYVTARGAAVALFTLCLVGCLIAAWRQSDIIAGLAYCAGCLAVPVAVRREAQLQVVMTPPAVFLVAVLVTQALTAQGSSTHGSVLSVLEGTFLMLAATAPWLIIGGAGCIAVAMSRGLPGCVREFRAGFRGERSAGSWHRLRT